MKKNDNVLLNLYVEGKLINSADLFSLMAISAGQNRFMGLGDTKGKSFFIEIETPDHKGVRIIKPDWFDGVVQKERDMIKREAERNNRLNDAYNKLCDNITEVRELAESRLNIAVGLLGYSVVMTVAFIVW